MFIILKLKEMDKMCIGTRKRTLSSTDDVEPKKIHSTIDNEMKNISPADLPKMAESELFIFSAIQDLANNISLSFNNISTHTSWIALTVVLCELLAIVINKYDN
jgi:hypothetical protein